MTYKQAQELGGQVSKGETSATVVKYGTFTRENDLGVEKELPYARAYLPEMMHDRETVNTSVCISELRELGRIVPRSLAAGLGPKFSDAIRQGVPVPD